MMIYRVFCCLTLLFPSQSESASRDVLQKLHRSILKHYDPSLRPVNDTSEPVHVGFRFTPTLCTLDEIEQKLFLRGMLVLRWTDPQLTWQPHEYEGINETKLSLVSGGGESLIWKPELVLNESLHGSSNSLEVETTAITVYSSGLIYWYTLANLESFCSISVRYYPFDTQSCHLTFTTWLYQTDQQQFSRITDIIDHDSYKKYILKHGLWSLDIALVEASNASYDCETCDGEMQSYVHYILELKRGQRSLHFLALILPCMVMSGMTTLVICLPRTPDSKAAAFGLSCILTLFVFLSFLFNKLPSTGQPVIGGYVVWLIVEGVIITAYVLIKSRFAAKDKKTPRWLKLLKYTILGIKILSTFIYSTIFIVLVIEVP